ncbi:hypothetical protein EDB80DRAFT_691617 [Ilyonectria destructans]|nr:hypothetical protein EDB80DRAFT_691617 [Ilyonectria destructans]
MTPFAVIATALAAEQLGGEEGRVRQTPRPQLARRFVPVQRRHDAQQHRQDDWRRDGAAASRWGYQEASRHVDVMGSVVMDREEVKNMIKQIVRYLEVVMDQMGMTDSKENTEG